MQINTGKGSISLMTLIAIWSISALTSLPGLAVSPILGELSSVFPRASELDLQMLTSLPSLLIIPFVLLSGKLAERRDFVRLLQVGLWIFVLSGALYLVSGKMWQLLFVSALLGVGAGIIIPLSTGLISRYFSGKERVRQFGYSSAITNSSLVIATAVTGYLAEVDWHLPFVVYLLPLGAILLSVYLRNGKNIASKEDKDALPKGASTDGVAYGKYGVNVPRLLKLMLFYGVITYIVLVINLNLPFLMEAHHFSTANSGWMISLFFLSMMAPGFMLNTIVGWLKSKTIFTSLLLMAVGLLFIWISPTEDMIIPGCLLSGFGYGIIQPLIYEKTVKVATTARTTLALACVMAMNYVAILLAPFVTDFFQWLLNAHSLEFPFALNLGITLLTLYWAYVEQRSFLFR